MGNKKTIDAKAMETIVVFRIDFVG